MLTSDATTVRPPRWIGIGLWIALPVLGAVLGVLLTRLPAWLTALPEWVFALPFAPDEERFSDLAAVIGLPAVIVLAVIGMLAGAFLALMAAAESFTVTVDESKIVITRGDDEIMRRPTQDVRSAFLDEGELVLLDHDGAEPFRGRTDLDDRSLQAALTGHGIRWEQADPYDHEFTRWVDGVPGLEEHANAVLRERRRSLEKGDEDDASALRTEAARLGVVVRDRADKQQWRVCAPRRPTRES